MTQIEQLNEIISVGDKVEELINCDTWKEYVEPILDKMIVDILGGKVNGRYVSAPQQVEESKCDLPALKFLLGYKAGLIMFHEKGRIFRINMGLGQKR